MTPDDGQGAAQRENVVWSPDLVWEIGANESNDDVRILNGSCKITVYGMRSTHWTKTDQNVRPIHYWNLENISGDIGCSLCWT